MRERWKRWFGFAAAGAALSLIAVMMLGPRLIAWRYEAPDQEALSCGPAVRAALGSYARMEGYSTLAGAAAGFVLALLIKRRPKPS